MRDEAQIRRIPTSSREFWIWLLVLFASVIGLTMWKDWWLTGEKPNVLFYLAVPPLSMLGGVLGMFWVVKAFKLPIPFLEITAILVGVNLVMQALEVPLKLIYYRVWEYPGWLYLLVVIPTGFGLGVYALVHWGRLSWGKAALLMAAGLGCELLAAGFVSSFSGLSTPGS